MQGYVMTNIIPTVLFDPPVSNHFAAEIQLRLIHSCRSSHHLQNNPAMWEVESTGGIRAPLYTGAFTVDDLFALSPCVIQHGPRGRKTISSESIISSIWRHQSPQDSFAIYQPQIKSICGLRKSCLSLIVDPADLGTSTTQSRGYLAQRWTCYINTWSTAEAVTVTAVATCGTAAASHLLHAQTNIQTTSLRTPSLFRATTRTERLALRFSQSTTVPIGWQQRFPIGTTS